MRTSCLRLVLAMSGADDGWGLGRGCGPGGGKECEGYDGKSGPGQTYGETPVEVHDQVVSCAAVLRHAAPGDRRVVTRGGGKPRGARILQRAAGPSRCRACSSSLASMCSVGPGRDVIVIRPRPPGHGPSVRRWAVCRFGATSLGTSGEAKWKGTPRRPASARSAWAAATPGGGPLAVVDGRQITLCSGGVPDSDQEHVPAVHGIAVPERLHRHHTARESRGTGRE